MEIMLSATEARILGSLIEKELATPDYYPLSLNALVNACNQKSNRDPVVSYDEETVRENAAGLSQKGLVWKSDVGRVSKYEERFTHDHKFVGRESAILCILLLRGPQTVGEIRGRTARLYNFDDLDEVNETLTNLEEWGMVKRLARMPGHKESRYTHLLCGEPETVVEEAAPVVGSHMDDRSERMDRIEEDIEALRNDLYELKSAFSEFKKLFD
jgi:uncharacterized protein